MTGYIPHQHLQRSIWVSTMYPNRFNRNVVPDNSFQQSRVPTLASARDVSVDLNQVPTRKTAKKWWRLGGYIPTWAKFVLGLGLLCAVTGAIVGPIVYLALQDAPTTTTTTTTTTSTTSTSSTSTSTTSTTSTSTTSTSSTSTTSTTTTTTTTSTTSTSTTSTTTTTTTTTETTTTAPCLTGYTRTPSGSCVNLLIDFNNCGSIGYVCASTYISCSNGACSGVPAVQLVGAVVVPGWGGQFNIDDAYINLAVPFNISLYSTTTDNPAVQSNGCVCLGTCSTAYTNGNLPDSQFDATAFGYWDDLYIYAGTSESVYYGTTGVYPNRNLVYEFYMSHYAASNQYYHFQIIFYEASPGIVRYYYFQDSDGGASATIGVQASASGPSMTYAVNQPTAVPVGTLATSVATLILEFNTNTGTYTSVG